MTRMTRSDITALFDRREEAWRRRDPAALSSSHAEDGLVVSPIFGRIRGRPAIEQSYRDLFTRFADWTLRGQDLIVDGARVAQVFHVQASHTAEIFGLAATGRRFEIHGVLIFTMGDGLIAEERRLYDFTGLLLQLGVLKARPQ
jgi:steroid delta-isomerase-like uncharacterized protein